MNEKSQAETVFCYAQGLLPCGHSDCAIDLLAEAIMFGWLLNAADPDDVAAFAALVSLIASKMSRLRTAYVDQMAALEREAVAVVH
jgi:hypothetical protein